MKKLIVAASMALVLPLAAAAPVQAASSSVGPIACGGSKTDKDRTAGKKGGKPPKKSPRKG